MGRAPPSAFWPGRRLEWGGLRLLNWLSNSSWGSGKSGAHCHYHDHGAPTAFGGHVHVKIGGGQVLRVGLTGAPFHKQAIGQAPEDAQDAHGVGMADAPAVVVERDIQPLVQTIFNASETAAIEPQPSRSIQPLGAKRWSAGRPTRVCGRCSGGALWPPVRPPGSRPLRAWSGPSTAPGSHPGFCCVPECRCLCSSIPEGGKAAGMSGNSFLIVS